MSAPLLSVIIPLYRAEATLASCLDVLRSQQERRVQLIFVDDCSPDACGAILRAAQPELEGLGYQVMLLTQPTNQGVAAARNRGIEAATGRYLYALDADDLLRPDAFALLVQAIHSTEADLIGCDWMLQQGNSLRRMRQAQVSSGAEAWEALCRGSLRWNLWLWVIRRGLLEQDTSLRFVAGMNMGEDLGLMGRLFLRAQRVHMIPEPLYTYVRLASQQTAHYSPQHWDQLQSNMALLCGDAESIATSEALALLPLLKLQLKLPLLVTGRRADYKLWQRLYPEANAAIPTLSGGLHTRLLQRMAQRGCYGYVYLYYWIVLRGLYPLIYR